MAGRFTFMTLGEVVARLRKAFPMTQAALAEAIAPDYNQSNISRFENGWDGLSVGDLEKIAQALKVTPGDLYHLTSIPPHDAKWRAWLRVYGNLNEKQIDAVLALGDK